MRIPKCLTLVAVMMLPLLDCLSQAAKPPTTAQASASSGVFSEGEKVAAALQPAVSRDANLPLRGSLPACDHHSATDSGTTTNLGAASLVTPALFDANSTLQTNEEFSLDATNMDLEAESLAEQHSLALNLNESAFQKLDLNADGAVTLDEWQCFDTSAEAEKHFKPLDEVGDGQISVTEFLRQALKHPALYHLFGDRDKSNSTDSLWDNEVSRQQGLRLFSLHF